MQMVLILVLLPLAAFVLPVLAPGWRALGLIGAVMGLTLAWGWVTVLSDAPGRDPGFGAAAAVGLLFVVSWAALAGLITRGAQLALGQDRMGPLGLLGALAALLPSGLLAMN